MSFFKKISKKVWDDRFNLFLFISLGITSLFFVFNFIYGGEMFDMCVLDGPSLFCDYFTHLAGSSDRENLYSLSYNFCFPPLAYCMYYFLWKTNPYMGGESVFEWKSYEYSDNTLLVFLAFNIFMFLLLGYCISEYFEKKGAKYSLFLPIALLLSYPLFCTSLQRGNSVALTAILLSLAWLWMDSDSKIKRELALLLIAITAGLKIYPAILGLVYIKRKDWKRVCRLVFYGVTLFFIPFIFFGGIEGMLHFFSNLTNFATPWVPHRQVQNIWGMAQYIFERYLHIGFDLSCSLAYVVDFVFLFFSIICFFLSKRKWQNALFLSGILASFFPSSWWYTIVYYLSPLLLLLKETEENRMKKGDKLEVFSIVSFALFFTMNFILEYICGVSMGIFIITYVLLGVNMVNVVYSFVKNHKSKHETDCEEQN